MVFAKQSFRELGESQKSAGIFETISKLRCERLIRNSELGRKRVRVGRTLSAPSSRGRVCPARTAGAHLDYPMTPPHFFSTGFCLGRGYHRAQGHRGYCAAALGLELLFRHRLISWCARARSAPGEVVSSASRRLKLLAWSAAIPLWREAPLRAGSIRDMRPPQGGFASVQLTFFPVVETLCLLCVFTMMRMGLPTASASSYWFFQF